MKRGTKQFAAIVAVTLALAGRDGVAGVLHEAQYTPPGQRPPERNAQLPRAATWQHHSPVVVPKARQAAAAPKAILVPSGVPRKQPAPQQHLFGYPTHVDPLFAEPSRPQWEQQHLEVADYDRPSYDVPDYEMPLYGLDAIQKPVYQMPSYLMPNDNKPNNYIKNYQAPPDVTPTMAEPVNIGPNYVIKPVVAPGYVPPTYDNPLYDRPQYKAPDYIPQEYAPPQVMPAPYIGPPK